MLEILRAGGFLVAENALNFAFKASRKQDCRRHQAVHDWIPAWVAAMLPESIGKPRYL